MQFKPLTLIYNNQSGFHAARQDEVYEPLLNLWSEAGYEIQSFDLAQQTDMPQFMRQVFARHSASHEVGVIVVAGGDGTLNAVATHVLEHPIPIAVIPLGTFNYVARYLNIPFDILEAAALVVHGKPQQVHVGRINEHIYLNNASLGLYPLFIKKRELYNRYLGRFPFNAYASGFDVLIRDRKELKLQLDIDQIRFPVKTSLLFFGNNQLQLEELNLKVAKEVEQGKVAGVLLAKSDKPSIFKALYRVIRGELEQAEDVYIFSGNDVKISLARKNITVAIDGEIVTMQSPLHFSVQKSALTLLVPHDSASV